MSVYSRGELVTGQRSGLSSAGARNLLVGQNAINPGILQRATGRDDNFKTVNLRVLAAPINWQRTSSSV